MKWPTAYNILYMLLINQGEKKRTLSFCKNENDKQSGPSDKKLIGSPMQNVIVVDNSFGSWL